jgi:hypothetical protein
MTNYTSLDEETSSVLTSQTEISYQPNRDWILYSLGCMMMLIIVCVLLWFLYKGF